MHLFRKFFGSKSAPPENPEPAKSSYRSVQVIGGRDCCAAATSIAGKRFLSDEVPKLPLADCDAAECRCTYQLFDDRRRDARRAGDVAFDIVSEYHADNRRSAATGRRDKD